MHEVFAPFGPLIYRANVQGDFLNFLLEHLNVMRNGEDAKHTLAGNIELQKFTKELSKMTTTLKLSNSLKSNKDLSYRILAQIASSVPKRVRFDSVDYNGKSLVTIQGVAASDQDILKFIENLGKQKLVEQASLSSMKMPKVKAGDQTMKGFRVFVKVKG